MSAIISILETVGVFLLGVVTRFGLVLLVMAAILIPVAIALGAARGFGWARRLLEAREPAAPSSARTCATPRGTPGWRAKGRR